MEQKWLVNLFIFFSFRDTNRLLYIYYDLLKSVVDLYIINVEIVLNINFVSTAKLTVITENQLLFSNIEVSCFRLINFGIYS